MGLRRPAPSPACRSNVDSVPGVRTDDAGIRA